jgi:hypothetical protein
MIYFKIRKAIGAAYYYTASFLGLIFICSWRGHRRNYWGGKYRPRRCRTCGARVVSLSEITFKNIPPPPEKPVN